MIANTANAKLGGVKTEEGKAAVRLNAITHGLTSKEVLLNGEDSDTLDALRANLMAELKPQGELETFFADLIVSDIWRLRRAILAEPYYLDWDAEKGESQVIESSAFYRKKSQATFLNLHPRETAIARSLSRDTVFKLERYRTTIERHLYRSIHQLMELQMARCRESPAKELTTTGTLLGEISV